MKSIMVFKKVVFLFLASLLTLHLSFTLLYNFELFRKGNRLSYLVYRYMFPFFNQNNKIFAPDPPFCKQQLYVRYKNKLGLWTRYQDLQAGMLHTHVNNRLSPVAMSIKHYDYVLRHLHDANSYADYYLSNSKDSLQNRDSLRLYYLHSYEGFNMAHRYFSSLIIQSPSATLFDSLQCRIVYTYPEKFKGKPLKEIKTSELTIDFPSLPILKYTRDEE